MSKDYKEDLPLKVERRRNAQQDMARLINLMYELTVLVKQQNSLLMDLNGVPPVPKAKLPKTPDFINKVTGHSH